MLPHAVACGIYFAYLSVISETGKVSFWLIGYASPPLLSLKGRDGCETLYYIFKIQKEFLKSTP